MDAGEKIVYIEHMHRSQNWIVKHLPEKTGDSIYDMLITAMIREYWMLEMDAQLVSKGKDPLYHVNRIS